MDSEGQGQEGQRLLTFGGGVAVVLGAEAKFAASIALAHAHRVHHEEVDADLRRAGPRHDLAFRCNIHV